jgi:hypothetical protein
VQFNNLMRAILIGRHHGYILLSSQETFNSMSETGKL